MVASTHALCSNGAQKLLGVVITLGEAVAYVLSGMYGPVADLGSFNATLIIVQVRVWGLTPPSGRSTSKGVR